MRILSGVEDGGPRRISSIAYACGYENLKSFSKAFHARYGVNLRIPPLRERREDIPLLFEHFASRAAEAHGRAMRSLSARLVQDLLDHPWPGNVRELRNAAERHAFGLDRLAGAPEPGPDDAQPLAARVEAFERDLICQALQQAQGSVADAMRLLDLPRRTLNEKMQRYGLIRSDFAP